MADVLRDAACEVLLSEKAHSQFQWQTTTQIQQGSCDLVLNPFDLWEKGLDLVRLFCTFAGGLFRPILPPGEFGAFGLGLPTSLLPCLWQQGTRCFKQGFLRKA